MRSAPMLLAAVVAAGCAAPNLAKKPVLFSAKTADDPVDLVTRAFALAGQTVTTMDHQLNIVQTRWENTGFGYGFVDVGGFSVGAVIWRRYTAIISRKADQADVALRADTQRCAESARTEDGLNVLGNCTTLWADGLVPEHQQELEALGERVRVALGGTAPAAPPAQP